MSKEQNQGMVVKHVATKKVSIEYDKNNRSLPSKSEVYDGVLQLAQDIGRNGLMQPVVGCENPDGTYTLYAGYRRFQAIQKLGWDTIPMTIVPPKSEKDRALINMRENLSRDNLTSYDKARALKRLQEQHKMTQKQIAAELAGDLTMNNKHVSNLLLCIDNLHPTILEAWQEGHPLASTMRLFVLQKLPLEGPGSQIEKWNEATMAEAKNLDNDKDAAAIMANPFDTVAWQKAMAGKSGRGKKGASVRLDTDGNVIDDDEKQKKTSKPKPSSDTVTLVLSWLADGIEGLSPESHEAMVRAVKWMQGDEQLLVCNGVTIFDPEAEKARKEERAKELQAQKTLAKAQEMMAKAQEMMAQAKAASEGKVTSAK